MISFARLEQIAPCNLLKSKNLKDGWSYKHLVPNGTKAASSRRTPKLFLLHCCLTELRVGNPEQFRQRLGGLRCQVLISPQVGFDDLGR
jgi:hypothetical protein